MKLGKIATICIKNNVTGNELSYLADNSPHKSTLGHAYFGTLNCVGIKALQEQGYTINNDRDWCKILAEKFNLPANAVGTRGPSWRYPEDREQYSITIDGVDYNPAITQKALQALEQKKITPTFELNSVPLMNKAVADVSEVSLFTPPAQATEPVITHSVPAVSNIQGVQTPAQVVTQMIQEDIAQKYHTPVDSEVVAKIKEVEKTYPQKEIMMGLNKKYGPEQSVRLWELAHTKTETPKVSVSSLF